MFWSVQLCFQSFKCSYFQKVIFQVLKWSCCVCSTNNTCVCASPNLANVMFVFCSSKCHGPASIWEHQTRNVVTKTILYKRYREVLFQKVALGYLSHFVHNISSNKRTKTYLFAQKYKTKSEKCLKEKYRIYSPLTPDQPPFKGGRYVYTTHLSPHSNPLLGSNLGPIVQMAWL